jgi:hypothetical protein
MSQQHRQYTRWAVPAVPDPDKEIFMRIGDQDTLLPTMIMAYSNPRWYDFVSAPYNVPFGEFIEDRTETEVFKDAAMP